MPDKFRLVMLGRLGVGKSALTVKYLTQRFIMEYDPYIDGKYSKLDMVGTEPVIIRVWDTYTHSGSCIELDKYIKWADGFMVVYSTTSKSSFLEAQAYLKHIHIQCRNKAIDVQPIILVGNKRDLDRYRQVDLYEGQEMADSFGTLFQECCATGKVKTVESLFHNLVKEIQHDRELCSSVSTLVINEPFSPTGSLPKSLTRRSKGSPKSSTTSPRLLKKSSSTFKIFNKGFKFFT